MDAADLNAAPLSLGGMYTDSVTDAGSCDPTADNVAWFTYTPAVSGLYDLSFTNNASTSAFSRIAIFEGSSCSPLGNEIACEMASSAQIDTLALLEANTPYTIMFYTDGPAYPMVSPTANIAITSSGPGSICELAEDVTSATFPYTMSGTFDEDPPTLGSCTSSSNNVAWFSYTAPTTDTYLIEASNQTSTYAYSRIVVLESDACSPLGAELACDTNSSTEIETEVDMIAGQDYLIAFHTDGDSYTMVNPVVNVGVKPPPPPGGECDSAVDVTAQTLPYQQLGLFEDDPSNASPSCDTAPTNAVWFLYQPTATDWYDLTLTNNTLDNSYSRVAIFEGTSCSPPGPELYCGTESDTTITTDSVYLTAGVTYTVLFYTDGDSYDMEDPSLDVAVGTAPAAGENCSVADDLSSASFPYTLTGTFDNDVAEGSTCDTSPTNVVWYSYTPTVTQAYDISAVNNTTTNAFSRLAVFEGTMCNPLGAEVTCTTNLATTAALTGVTLTAGTTYLIAFHTDGNTYTMVDPEITITP